MVDKIVIKLKAEIDRKNKELSELIDKTGEVRISLSNLEDDLRHIKSLDKGTRAVLRRVCELERPRRSRRLLSTKEIRDAVLNFFEEYPLSVHYGKEIAEDIGVSANRVYTALGSLVQARKLVWCGYEGTKGTYKLPRR